MMKMKTSNKQKILIVLIILTIAFIWGNSLFDKEKSAQESGFVVKILEVIFGTGNVSEHFVRKLAHFTEYAVLGAELNLLFGKYLLGATHGLFVALVDETIQILSQRGSSILDVWLDFSGVLFGSLVMLILIKIINASRKIKS